MWSRSIHHKHTKSLIIVVRPKHPPNCSKFTTDVQFRITLTDHSSSGHWPSFVDVGRSSAIGVDFFHNFVQAKYQPLCAVNSGTNYKYCRLQRVMYCIRRTAVVARKKLYAPAPCQLWPLRCPAIVAIQASTRECCVTSLPPDLRNEQETRKIYLQGTVVRQGRTSEYNSARR